MLETLVASVVSKLMDQRCRKLEARLSDSDLRVSDLLRQVCTLVFCIYTYVCYMCIVYM